MRMRDETRDHLFFACPYSFTVWNRLVNRLSGHRTDPDWMTSFQFLSSNRLPNMDRLLMKMAFQTCIYHIWKERNARRHQTGYCSIDQVVRTIDNAMRNRITSLRYKAGHQYADLLSRWFEVIA